MNFKTRASRPVGSPKEIAARAVNQLGGVKRAAHILGRSPAAVSAWTLESAPTEIPYGSVQMATLNGALAFTDNLCALAGGAFTPELPGNENNIETLIAGASEKFGRFLGAVLAGGALRNPHESQAAQLHADLDETIRALVATRKCLILATERGRHDRNIDR